jgi:hypothetical protein
MIKKKGPDNCLTSLILLAGIAIFLCPFPANATNYYVDSIGGNDNNPGDSASRAWKTIAKVNSAALKPGDSVLFSCGQTWRQTLVIENNGTPEKPITYGSYGAGEKPILSIDTGIDNNTVKINSCSNLIVKDLCLENGQAWGGTLLIYASQNVQVRNSTIRNGVWSVVDIRESNNVVLESCSIYGCTKTSDPYGFVVQIVSSNGCTVRGCKMYDSSNTTGATVLDLYESSQNIVEMNEVYGPSYNGIYIRPYSHSNIVRYNFIHDIDGVGIQIREGSNNNTLLYNILSNNWPAIHSDGDTPISGTKIFNNTIYASGINHNGIIINHTNTNCQIRNNIIFVGEDSGALNVHAESIKGTSSDYNCFMNVYSPLVIWGSVTYHKKDFQKYLNDTGMDSHSILADPLFSVSVPQAIADFMPQGGSPVINAGSSISGLTRDILGYVLTDSKPDMGALERQSLLPAPMNVILK